jgi:hypothetical protein
MSTSNLPPLPAPTCGAVGLPATEIMPARAIWTAYSADDMHAYASGAVAAERKRCAALLAVTRGDLSLAVGEMTAGEWRTCSAVLQVLRNRMRQT